jgi:NAD(P)-dependent dehydrogenase (short-subunit alcohol dehydrogenase family)
MGYAPVMPIAIITGSDSGIGKATAVQLAQDNFDIGITWHRDEGGANETAEEVRRHGRRAEVRKLDLLKLPKAADVIDQLADALGGIDVLVNNSGTSRKGKAIELSFEDWRETLSVDLDGAFLCAQRAARRMIEQGHGAASSMSPPSTSSSRSSTASRTRSRSMGSAASRSSSRSSSGSTTSRSTPLRRGWWRRR